MSSQTLRSLERVVVFSCLVLCVCACGDDGEEQPEFLVPVSPPISSVEEGSAALIGVVLDIQSRDPVEGVVVFTDPETQSVRTNARGEFVLTEGLFANTVYTLVAEEPRYRSVRVEVLTAENQISRSDVLMYPDGDASLLLPNPSNLLLTRNRRRAPVFLENLAGASVSWFLAHVSYSCADSNTCEDVVARVQGECGEKRGQLASGGAFDDDAPSPDMAWLSFSNLTAERRVFPGSPDILEVTVLRNEQGTGDGATQALIVLCDSQDKAIGIRVQADQFSASAGPEVRCEGGQYRVEFDGKPVEGELVECVQESSNADVSITTEAFTNADGVPDCGDGESGNVVQVQLPGEDPPPCN